MRTLAQGQEREPPLELPISRQRYRPTLRFVKQLASASPISGLDIGCGYQAQFVRIANKRTKAHFQGCDIAVDPTDHDLFALNLAAPVATGRTYDLVTLHAVFEHLDEPAAALQFIATMLKPGGYLVVTTPTPLGKVVLEFLAYRLNVISRREVDEHKHYWTRKRFDAFFAGHPLPYRFILHHYYQLFLNNWVLLQKNP